MTFRAVVTKSTDEGEVSTSIQTLPDDRLPEGNVTVAIEYTTVNYKDGLCMQPDNGLVRSYPHVAGIDFAGTVEDSSDSRFQVGDQVVLTGWGVGEKHWGGFAQKARVDADWLVPLPQDLTTREAMAIGTAGFAAMIAVIALEEHGLVPSPPGQDPKEPDQCGVLVTGASGGVGSIATALLSHLGHDVVAVTGRSETADYLMSLGAKRILARSEIDSVCKRPLESATWAGCVDAVGGEMLARVIGQLRYGASVAAVGLAGGAALPTSVLPFLLRGVNLLGIDSVMYPAERRAVVWQRLASDLPREKLHEMIRPATFDEIPQLAKEILRGQIQGRIVVDVNA